MTSDPDLLNAREAADLLGTHVETVRRLARRGDIPSFKVGSDWRFSRRALRRWFEEREPRSRPFILVVDDDSEVVRSISRMVEWIGCTAQGATNGAEALEMVGRRTPDLIFLDLMMPEMNGPDFLDRLRVIHPALPVVIVTGHPDSDLMHRAAQHAPIMVLSKPSGQPQVERTVRTVLGDRLPVKDAAREGS